jgi:hypothetical protein
MAASRFERLERERAAGGNQAARPSPLEARFGGAGEGQTEAPARSGSDAVRFEEPESGNRIRVLETERGQAYVRCAHCRSDNHVTASRCGNCDADLVTPEQRTFNEALWRRLEAEKAEDERAVQALRERRAAAESEQAEAMRRRQELEIELKRRRELGLPLDDEDDVSDPLRAAARAVGRFIGGGLARVFPDRRARLAAVALSGLGLLALFIAYPWSFFSVLWILLILAGLTRRLGRARRGGFGE